MSGVEVVVDRTTCTGIGLCEAAAQDVFRVDDDGLAAVVEGSLGGASIDELHQAADGCPTRSIRIALS